MARLLSGPLHFTQESDDASLSWHQFEALSHVICKGFRKRDADNHSIHGETGLNITVDGHKQQHVLCCHQNNQHEWWHNLKVQPDD